MRKTAIAVVLLFLLGSCAIAGDSKSEKKSAAAPLKLKVGDMAPDFTLLSFDGKELKRFSLSDYRGKKNVALAFYVFAFTGG